MQPKNKEPSESLKTTDTETRNAVLTAKNFSRRNKLFAQIFNIMNTTLGSGVLSLAYTASTAGLASILFILTIYFVLSLYSFYAYSFAAAVFYGSSSTLSTDSSYVMTLKDVWAKHFPKGKYLIDIVIIINCFFGCVSYLVAIGNFIPTSLPTFLFPSVNHKEFFTKTLVLFLISVLQFLVSLLKSLESLKYVSIFGFSANFLLIFLGFYEFIQGYRQKTGYFERLGLIWFGPAKSLLKYSGVLVVCYNCHYASIPIFRTLVPFGAKRKTQRKNEKVGLKSQLRAFKFISLIAYLGVLFVNVLITLSGYLAFGKESKSNVVLNFKTDLVAAVLKLSIIISVGCSYPLVFRSYRESFFNILGVLKPGFINQRKIQLDFLNILLIFFISMLTNDISIVNTLRGCIMGTQIVYTIPGLLLIGSRKQINKKHYLGGIILVVVGILMSILGLYGVFYN